VLAKATRWQPTLPHEQFGGGLLEKYPQGNSPAAYPTSRTDLWATGGEIPPVDPALTVLPGKGASMNKCNSEDIETAVRKSDGV
jgi:hypothetical protein